MPAYALIRTCAPMRTGSSAGRPAELDVDEAWYEGANDERSCGSAEMNAGRWAPAASAARGAPCPAKIALNMGESTTVPRITTLARLPRERLRFVSAASGTQPGSTNGSARVRLSSRTRCRKASTLTISCFLPVPRARTASVPASASRFPMTAIYGIFIVSASRIR